jgi:mRNA interferase RelE/StbE
MSAWKIEWKPRASKSFIALPKSEQRRIAKKVDALADNPTPPGSQKLSGKENIFRFRVGNYRVIYKIRKRVLVVLVLNVGHRKEVYRKIF